MARPRDISFEREGRSMSAWLLDLVGDESSARLAAGEALEAMMCGLPSHADPREFDRWSSRESQDQVGRFKVAVRAATRSPGFPAPEFVRRLISRRVALQEDWRERSHRYRRHVKARSRWEGRLLERLFDADDEADTEVAARRYRRWLDAWKLRDRTRSEEIYAGGITAGDLDPEEPLDRAILALRGEIEPP